MWIRKKIEIIRMNIEANRILNKLKQNPNFEELKPPPELKERIYAEIERREQEKQRILSEEQQELIRMGIRYQKQKKRRKYVVIAAIAVLLFSMGMTCLGGAEKVFYRISSIFMNRGREVVDSGGVEVMENPSEEEVYAEIEQRFGFYPVKLGYKLEGTTFKEASFFDDMPAINMVYGSNDQVSIIYWIRPQYVNSSWGKDIEDELLEAYTFNVKEILFSVKKYEIEKNHIRWMIQFDYNQVNYTMYVLDADKEEIERIIINMHIT